MTAVTGRKLKRLCWAIFLICNIFLGWYGLANAATAAAPDLTAEGWDRARWGMSSEELRTVYAERVKSFERPFQYHDAYADVALPGIELAGARFTALFQMDQATGGLRQVLIERRRHYATIALFRAVEGELTSRYGAPCRRMDAAGEPSDNSIAVLERAWVVPEGAVHLSFINFRNDIPKRLALRYHPRGRPELMASRPPPTGLKTAAHTIDRCPPS